MSAPPRNDRAFEQSALGGVDACASEAPVKPCLKRIDHANVSKYETAITWCGLADGHDGQCSGPLPSILELDDTGPGASKRRRW